MIEKILEPNWIKDALGVLFVVVTGALYAAGVTHGAPCNCGPAASADDAGSVEAAGVVIDVVSQGMTVHEL